MLGSYCEPILVEAKTNARSALDFVHDELSCDSDCACLMSSMLRYGKADSAHQKNGKPGMIAQTPLEDDLCLVEGSQG
jgi:hypothetical protein